jgi:hypothetical protein
MVIIISERRPRIVKVAKVVRRAVEEDEVEVEGDDEEEEGEEEEEQDEEVEGRDDNPGNLFDEVRVLKSCATISHPGFYFHFLLFQSVVLLNTRQPGRSNNPVQVS